MAFFSLFSPFSSLFRLVLLFLMSVLVISQGPPLNTAEQEAVYKVLESVNSEIPWRSLFPDDFCASAPHGFVCDYFPEDDDGSAAAGDTFSAHVTELNFGYVSDYSPNPPCSADAALNTTLFTPFGHLKKLFFYKCFTENPVSFPDFLTTLPSLEELIFVENPALVGAISGSIGNFINLKRIVLTGTNASGGIPDGFDLLTNLEEVTLSRNQLNGGVSVSFEKLKKLKVLDLSQNGFAGNIPESIGNLSQLLKLDLSFNNFSGKIPENFKYLKGLEFLDLSYNRFGNFGVPLILGEMTSLKEVYLSGNLLGGVIPEIWENLGEILRLGLSSTGLVGKIPISMGVHLKNACYIGLDNNKLEGTVPKEFETLEFVNELNLENNNLSGKVPFSANFASRLKGKLKLKGNTQLCVDEGLRSAKLGAGSKMGQLKLCTKPDDKSTSAIFSEGSPMPLGSHLLMLFGFLFLYH